MIHLPLHSGCHISLLWIVFYFPLCQSLLSAFSSSIIVSHRGSSPRSPPSLSLSRNKAINKKSTAFSVPPHYRLLMYAFCSSITHQPQINALIFPSCRIDFGGSDSGAESGRAGPYAGRLFPEEEQSVGLNRDSCFSVTSRR